MSEFQKDELSIEETNKLRISLGLNPLPVDDEVASRETEKDKERKKQEADDTSDPLKNQDETAAKNFADYQEELRKKREEEETRLRIAKAQNRREFSKKLQGRTLGDEDPSDATTKQGSIDAKKWIKAQRKRAIENSEKRLQEEAEAEEAAAAEAAKYSEADLSGLKVGHDIDDLGLDEGGKERILTLRDAGVLDDAEDELMDSMVERQEQDRLNNERKKGVKKYTGLDDDEFEETGRKKGILSQYDADIDGSSHNRNDKDSGFRLGGNSVSQKERNGATKKEPESILNRKMLDLDYTKNEELSDYLKEGDAGFKKPKMKKKKKRAHARIQLEDDDAEEQGASKADEAGDVTMVDGNAPMTSAKQKVTQSIDTFLDDDDLAASLAKARRKQVKRTFQKTTPEMIAQNLAKQREAEEAEKAQASRAEIDQEGDGMTFDDTSEFVRNIQFNRQKSLEPPQERHLLNKSPHPREGEDAVIKEEPRSPNEGSGIDASHFLQEEHRADVKQEDEGDEDQDMSYASGDRPKVNVPSSALKEEDVQHEDEPLVGGGLASTLSFLRNQGMLTEMTPEQRERERQQREYDAWLAVRRMEDKMREAELAASKAQGSAKDQATREYENRMREVEDARRAQSKFKDYKPDIEIKYHDEFGRQLSQHDAWKKLSHQFHGKAPGQKKQNQRLQRIENERKQEKMMAGDTPSGMTNAFAERAERSGQAHMVLGVGARNNAPQDIGTIGPNTVPQQSNNFRGKEKVRAHAETMDNTGYTNAPRGNNDGIDSVGITSMVPRSTTTRTKAGFTPVRPVAANPITSSQTSSFRPLGAPQQTNGTSGPAKSKFKLAFGKRSAAETSSAEPPTKVTKQEQ